MDFTAGLLRLLSKEMSSKMEELVEETYLATLKLHHGWIASAAFKVYSMITLVLAKSYLKHHFTISHKNLLVFLGFIGFDIVLNM